MKFVVKGITKMTHFFETRYRINFSLNIAGGNLTGEGLPLCVQSGFEVVHPQRVYRLVSTFAATGQLERHVGDMGRAGKIMNLK